MPTGNSRHRIGDFETVLSRHTASVVRLQSACGHETAEQPRTRARTTRAKPSVYGYFRPFSLAFAEPEPSRGNRGCGP